MTYGISIFSIIPVRKEPNERSEMVTQLVFGEVYQVLQISENQKWIQLKIAFDDYEGWIDVLLHHEVHQAYFQRHLMESHGLVYDDVALVENKNRQQLITLGSTLPFLMGRDFQIGAENYRYEGDIYEITNQPDEETIQFLTLRFMHVPYLWGGKTLFGTDCSGLVQTIYKLLGYRLKRDAYQQIEHGISIENVSLSKTGDLAFFHNDQNKIIHVGIILPEQRIIHAHGQVRIDYLDEKGILNLTTKKYSHNLNCVKRIIV